jgi:hypothetical protein
MEADSRSKAQTSQIAYTITNNLVDKNLSPLSGARNISEREFNARSTMRAIEHDLAIRAERAHKNGSTIEGSLGDAVRVTTITQFERVLFSS